MPGRHRRRDDLVDRRPKAEHSLFSAKTHGSRREPLSGQARCGVTAKLVPLDSERYCYFLFLAPRYLEEVSAPLSCARVSGVRREHAIWRSAEMRRRERQRYARKIASGETRPTQGGQAETARPRRPVFPYRLTGSVQNDAEDRGSRETETEQEITYPSRWASGLAVRSRPQNMSYFMVDIEADGPIPGRYSMVSFGAIVVEPGLHATFYGQLQPISDQFVPEALAVSGFSREETLAFPNAARRDAASSRAGSPTTRPAARCSSPTTTASTGSSSTGTSTHFLGKNPFGHSSTNLGSLYKGLVKDIVAELQAPARTQHTHHPVDERAATPRRCCTCGKRWA